MKQIFLILFIVGSFSAQSATIVQNAVVATVPGKIGVANIKSYEGCRIQTSPLFDYAGGENGYIVFEVRPTASGNYTFKASIATGTGSNRFCSLGPVDSSGKFLNGASEKTIPSGTNSSDWTQNMNDYEWVYFLKGDSVYTIKVAYRKNGEAYGVNLYKIDVTSDAIADYTVSYFDKDGKLFISQPYPIGSKISLPNEKPVAPEGYMFSHWVKASGEIVLNGTSASTMDVFPVWIKAEWLINNDKISTLPVDYITKFHNCVSKGDQLIDNSKNGSFISFDGKVQQTGYYLFTSSIGTKLDQIGCILGYTDNSGNYITADTVQIENNGSWTSGKPYKWMFYLEKDSIYKFKMQCLAGSSYGLNAYWLKAETFVPNTKLKTALIDEMLVLKTNGVLQTNIKHGTNPIINIIGESDLANIYFTAAHKGIPIEIEHNNRIICKDVPVGDTIKIQTQIKDGPLSENHFIYLIVDNYKQRDIRGGLVNDGSWNSSWTNNIILINPKVDSFEFNNASWIRSDGKTVFGFKTKNSQLEINIPKSYEIKEVSIIGYSTDGNEVTFKLNSSNSEIICDQNKFSTNTSAQKPEAVIYKLNNHQAGMPLILDITGGSCQMYLRIKYSDSLDIKSPQLIESNITNLQVINSPNGKLRFKFDEAVIFSNQLTAIFNNQSVTPTIEDNIYVCFDFWGLDYNSEQKFEIKANSIVDEAGNMYPIDIVLQFKIGNHPPINKKNFDFVVGINGNINQAITAANNASGSSRFYIFIPTGSYELSGNEADHMTSLTRNNVSIIGQSMDSSIIYNIPSSYGISTTATIHLKYSTKIYMQDITLRNMKGESGLGQQVALFDRGSQNIFKNVKLFSYQDTYVSGHRGYFEDCSIYGGTDYICGGGDVFFQNCLMFNRTDGNVIVAPSTETSQKWGYVFMNCKIDGGTFTLGRPWQNEPRATFLNTRMKRQPSGTGWAGMSDLNTHFYEYKSMDWNGTDLDLKIRGNSPSSINKYIPVLNDEQALKYTLYNVLKGNDGWVPTVYTRQISKPELVLTNNIVTWVDKEDVLCTFIFKNGEYFSNTSSNSIILTEPGVYTFRHANEMGGLGEQSQLLFQSTGLETINIDKKQSTFFDVYGRPAKKVKKGAIYINSRDKTLNN